MFSWQTRPTIVDYVLPQTNSRVMSFLKDVFLVVVFSLFLALCAQGSIPMMPVPITLQTLGVVLIGAALGSRRGFATMLLYLAEGAIGLPFFAQAKSGLAVLTVGPTAGYLWAFPLAAFLVGYLCERRLERSFKTSILVMIPASILILSIGTWWLGFSIYHGNYMLAITQGLLPFIPGDIIKEVTAALLLPTAWSFVRWIKPPTGPDQVS